VDYMNLKLLRGRKWNYTAIAFAIPFAAFLMLLICVGATPFGSKSLLYSDCFHQYFPFFKEYRSALLSGQSLLYSWNVGMGMDYLGLISYYLASPLNLFSVFIPESWLLPYFTLLTPVKLGLASMFFAIFIKKLYGKNDFSIALFGSFYGLCAWALGYQWNVMWLDTFALLPLVALGTVSLLRDKKFILYTVTLALSLLINYYIGFFTCIFVLLIFICYQICRCKSVKRFFLDFVRIGIFTVIAIGLTAILTLPTLAALGTTYSSNNSFPSDFALNIVNYEKVAPAAEAWNAFKIASEAGEPAIGLWFTAVWKSFGPVLDGMGQVAGNLSGGSSTNFIAAEGLPNVFSGVTILFLSFLFLMARNIKMRDKLCSIGILLFLFASFVIRQLDYIWHGFHFTNMIPYRFSFIVSFVLIFMAYRAYLVRFRFKISHILIALLLTIEIFCLSKHASAIPDALGSLGTVLQNLGTAIAAGISGDAATQQAAAATLQSYYSAYGNTYVFFLYNLVFTLLVVGILVYPRCHRTLKPSTPMAKCKEVVLVRANRRRVSSALLSAVMVVELVMMTVSFGFSFAYTDITGYPQGTGYSESMIKYMKERDPSLFYRVETTHAQTLNDGALNGYNGISTFTSSANVKVTDYLCDLGFAAQNNWNRYCYEESSPVANLFLNLKYMIERSGQVEENPYFTDVHHYGSVHLLENNAYLPLGFLAESELGTLELRKGSSHAFENQNMLFSASTGIPNSVWNVTPESWLTMTGNNVTITGQHSMGYCAYNASASGGNVIFRYEVQEEGLFCMDVNMYARNSFHVYLNNNYLYTESVVLPQTFSVSYVKPGDVVEIHALCAANENSSMNIRAAILDDDVFQTGYKLLNISTLNLTEFSTTKVAGNINCNRDGMLYTSIPDNGNWKVYVDGVEAEQTLICGAMVGVEMTKGNHQVVFVYENKAFQIGCIISVMSLLVFLGLIYLSDREAWNGRFKTIQNRFKKSGKKSSKKKSKK